MLWDERIPYLSHAIYSSAFRKPVMLKEPSGRSQS